MALMIEVKDDALELTLEHNLDLFLGMDGLYQICGDAGLLGAPDVSEELVADEDRGLGRAAKLFHGKLIAFARGLPGLEDIKAFHGITKGFHARFLVVRENEGLIA